MITISDFRSNDNDKFVSRQEYRKKRHGSDLNVDHDETYDSNRQTIDHADNKTAKSQRLKRRLDKIIVTLIILIVITYLILFLVNL